MLYFATIMEYCAYYVMRSRHHKQRPGYKNKLAQQHFQPGCKNKLAQQHFHFRGMKDNNGIAPLPPCSERWHMDGCPYYTLDTTSLDYILGVR